MKTPKIPSPKPAVQPTAPTLNTAGTFEAIARQRQQEGFLSTFIGANRAPQAQRLSQYLGGTSATGGMRQNPSGKVSPGGSIRR